jgi:hypothetical protein
VLRKPVTFMELASLLSCPPDVATGPDEFSSLFSIITYARSLQGQGKCVSFEMTQLHGLE